MRTWLIPAVNSVVVAGMAGGFPAQVSEVNLAQQGAWRAEINRQFSVAEKLPVLNAKVWGTFSPTPGVLADRVTYATAEGMLVTAVLYRPAPTTLQAAHVQQKLPAIVVVNGHGSDKFGWYAFYSGMMFAKAGAVVLTYDPIGEGERNEQRASMLSPSPHEREVTLPAHTTVDDWGRRIAGVMQDDLDQALRYVATRPEVDPARIGVVGYSMGSFVAGIAGARHTNVRALILSGGGTFDDDDGYFDKNKSICQRPAYKALKPLLTAGGKPARGFDLFYLNAERGPTLVMNGAGDGVMGIPDRDPEWFDNMRSRLLKTCGPGRAIHCENVFTSVMYPATVGHRPSWVNRDGVKWLNAQLHFAFWNTDAKIDAQGTTHVSQWITANKVAISPNYFREDREGGLEAVGNGLPGITRADLMVLPNAAWERMKDRLTYEAWAKKTLAAETLVAQPR